MPEVSAQSVKELRELTGAGILDARNALDEAGGDMEAAAEILSQKGLAKAEERSGRDAKEGAIALAMADNRCALVQLNSETDFAAKSDDFISLVDEIAQAVLKDGAEAAENMKAKIDEIRISKKENIELGRADLIEAAEGNSLDTYLHKQDGRGINAVVIEGSGVEPEALHQVSLHIAFAKPEFLSSDEVPKDAMDQQKAAALEQAKDEGKPEEAWEKIAQGKLTGWLKERVLLEQGLHGDKTKVADTLSGGSVVGFVQAYIK